MKVILLQDVSKIGSRSEIVEVPDGYAMNQLIPKRMAELATPSNIKRLERQTAKQEAGDAAAAESFAKALATLDATPLTITADANDKGHLFKAVSAAEVVTAAHARGAKISEAMVNFAEPIKTIGEHTITLTQAAKTASVVITVVPNKS
jgi:large subunit ribosomal protein L9